MKGRKESVILEEGRMELNTMQEDNTRRSKDKKEEGMRIKSTKKKENQKTVMKEGMKRKCRKGEGNNQGMIK